MKTAQFAILLFLINLSSYTLKAQVGSVQVVGAMKNVMREGKLFGVINIDTISKKSKLYGLGPVEYLSGELLIVDGITYKSTVINKEQMKVEEMRSVKAPFFVYSNQIEWDSILVPATVSNLQELEKFIDERTQSTNEPFAFKLKGIIPIAKIHIVNLPSGTKINKPDDTKKGQMNYEIRNEKSTIIGFFSRTHQSIFTHHDTYMHMHLITDDKQKMGHLDDLRFTNTTPILYLPKSIH